MNHTRARRLLLLVAFAACCAVNSPAIAQWGTLSGRFVYDGDPPLPATVAEDLPAFVDESLMVHPENNGIANIVIALRGTPAAFHPSLVEAAQQPVRMSQTGQMYSPRVVIAQVGQSMQFVNTDPTPNNVWATQFEEFQSTAAFNVLLAPGESYEHVFLGAAQQFPVRVRSMIYPQMEGFVIVKDHPYVVVTDENGHFELPNLPQGNWTFEVWHERYGYVTELTVEGASVEWRRGQVQWDVTAESQDLGEFLVSPLMLENEASLQSE